MSTGVETIRVVYVQQSEVPSFAYTIGLSALCGNELIFAGGLRFYFDDVETVLLEIARDIIASKIVGHTGFFVVRDLGEFDLRPVLDEWVRAFDPAVPASGYPIHWLQVMPTGENLTIDVPDLSRPRPLDAQDPFRWLDRDWNLGAPHDAHLVTTLSVLRGAPLRTVYRWELDQWEVLDLPAGEIDHDEARVAPIGLLACLLPRWQEALELEPGQGYLVDDTHPSRH